MLEKRRFSIRKHHVQAEPARLLSALMRFSMGIELSSEELADMQELEGNCSKHLSIVNDIYSFEKELKASHTGHTEGSYLCSAVKILAEEAHLGIDAAKRVLWVMVREWETIHDQLMAEALRRPGGNSETIRLYTIGLSFQMSGNEQWSKTTLRYK